MTQRRKSKKTEAEPRRVNRRTFLAGAGAAACVGAGLWLRRKKFSKRDKTKAEKQPVENPALPAGEWRAVWVSYLEWAAMDFSSADSFRAGCVQMLENCAGLGLNTVLAQVRPFGDALYKSQLFPWSHLCTGVQGQDPGFDPLDILLQEAHGRGLSVEAWLNPYRLRSSAAMPPNLAENNLANTHPEWVCAVGDGLYLNPAEPAAADYVVQGVAELVQNYAVDGIHFDDYFYPTTDPALDAAQFASSGAENLDEWRRQNVTALVKAAHDAVEAADPTLRFGISPQGNPDNDLATQYSDVYGWLAASGEEAVVDYLCPQIYWGYGYRLQSGSTRFALVAGVSSRGSSPRALSTMARNVDFEIFQPMDWPFSSSLPPATMRDRAKSRIRLLPSTAGRLPNRCWKQSCLAMRKGRLPARDAEVAPGCSKLPTAVRCFWMRLAKCRYLCRLACYGCWKKKRSPESVGISLFRSMSG